MARPTSSEWRNMMYAYVACTLLLAIKYQICQFIGANPENHPPEDKALLGNVPDVAEETKKRRARQAANDVENIPGNLVVFWAALYVQNLLNFDTPQDDGQNGTRALSAMIIIYTLSRMMYTVCYLASLQPFRSIFFIIGALSTWIAAAIMMYSVTQIDAGDYFP